MASARETARAVVDVSQAVIRVAYEEQIVFMAASLAYFAFISVIPLLLLVVIAVSTVQDSPLALETATYAARVLSPERGTILVGLVTDASDRDEATIIGIAVLLWGALLLFRALDDAFAQVYGGRQDSMFLGDFAAAVIVFVVVVIAIGLMIAANVVLSVVVRDQLWSLLAPFVLFVALSIVFLPMFYLFPAADVGLAEALPGTVFTAGAWTVVQTIFGLYTQTTGWEQLYGAASGFLLLLTWLYVGAFVLLVGVVLNAVLAGRVEADHDIAPLEYM